MRVLLIVNAVASSVTPRRKLVIEKALGADHELTVRETKRRGHAERLAHDAITQGYELVVVLAGDGTLNEAANGLRGSDLPLAPIPGGSTNVLARSLGYATDPIDATGQLLDAIAARSFERVSMGEANGRCFLFNLGFGFDAAVVRRVEARAALKRYVAHPWFLLAAFRTWFSEGAVRRSHISIEIAGADLFDECQLVIVSNSNPWTYLGSRPVVVAPDVRLSGPLAITALRDAGAARLIALGLSTLRSGRRLVRSRHVFYAPEVDDARVFSDVPFPYQVDGDYLGEVTEVRVRSVPDSLTLVIPAHDEAPPES